MNGNPVIATQLQERETNTIIRVSNSYARKFYINPTWIVRIKVKHWIRRRIIHSFIRCNPKVVYAKSEAEHLGGHLASLT